MSIKGDEKNRSLNGNAQECRKMRAVFRRAVTGKRA